EHLAQQKLMCHFNLGDLIDVQERHINNRKFRDSGVHGQFHRSSLLREMTVGVSGICSITSEVLASPQQRCATPITHPEYLITSEAAQRFLKD
ncbi:hypothetical protein J6590_103236, partial [Homalodisca vitripennis]